VVLSATALLFLALLTWLYFARNNEALARFIMETNNPNIRGRLEFRSIHWGPQAIVDMAMGVPSRVEVDHFAVYDPAGKRVIYTPRASASIEIYPLLLGGHHLLIHHIRPTRPKFLIEQMAGSKLRVGFLEAFAPTRPGTKPRDPRIELRDFDVKDASATLRFPAWSLELRGVSTRGSFLHGGGKVPDEGLVIDHHTRVESGTFRVGDVSLPVGQLDVRRLGGLKDAPTRIDVDLSGRIADSLIQTRGSLLDVYRGKARVDLQVTVRRAERLVARIVGAEGVMGDTTVKGTIRGPIARPRMEGKIDGLALGSGALRLAQLKGQAVLDLARHKLAVEQVQGKLMGGSVQGRGQMDLATGDWSGSAMLAGVNPSPVHEMLAGKLDGTVGLKGGARPLNRGLAVLKVRLRRTGRDLLPRVVDVTGSVHLGRKVVDLAGLTISGDGNSLVARGSLNLQLKQVNMFLQLGLPRLGQWLARRGLPDVVQSVRGDLHVTGRFPALRAAGSLGARGVGYGPARVQSMAGEIDFRGGVLELRKVRAQGYGGRLEGGARLDLFAGNLLRPRPVPLLQARLKAVGLDLTALGASPVVIGRLFGDAEISGPLNNLSGTATLRVPRATVQGDRYDNSQVRIGLLRDRVSIYQGSLARADGGRVSVWGDLYHDGNVDMRLRVTSFPVTGIPHLGHIPLGLAGKISGRVDLTGSVKAPRLEGALALAGAKIRGVSLGSGELTLTPGSDSVKLSGRFFGKLLALEGYLLTSPTPRLHLTLNLRSLPLEKLVYEVRQLGDVRGLLDGRVRLDLDAEKGLAWADARLTRTELFLRHRPPGSRRIQVVRLANDQDLLARFDGRQLHVVTARLLTTVEGKKGQRADFTLGGWLSSERADMRLRGKIAVELLEFFLAQRVRKLEGDATADIRLTGNLESPALDGGLRLHNVRIQMPKFDRAIEVPQGHVRLVPGSLRISGLQMKVGRQTMAASGKVYLRRFRPTMLDLGLKGAVDFKLLELLFPEQISTASGSAAVSLRVTGPVQDPQLEGRLVVRSLELSPRGSGRTITLRKGSVDLKNYVVKILSPLEGTYDEGMLRVNGTVRLDRWDLANIDLRITGLGIPQRQPSVYSAELNFNVELLGDSQRLELYGNVDLVDVRYVQKFDLIRRAFIKPRVHEEEDPIWKGSPLLENLALRLTVRSTGQMAVKNEYAQLSLSGAFSVVGTLAEPRIGGQVRVEEGTFTIPFLRGEYTIRRGDILFNKRKPVDEAELNITGETLFMDHNGTDFQVKLTLEGPLNHIGIKLSSNPSLEPGQIWALLATGRTTQQLRAQLKGAVDSGAGASGNQAAGAADAQVKQLTGEILNQIMVDPLKKATKLDLLRFEMGTESAQLKAGKRLGRFVNLAGEAEVGLLGDSRAEGRVEFKMHDLLMLVGKLERLSTRLETEDVDPSRGRIELKLRLPLR